MKRVDAPHGVGTTQLRIRPGDRRRGGRAFGGDELAARCESATGWTTSRGRDGPGDDAEWDVARLALRAPDSQQIVDVAVGETVTVPGEGAVTLDGVHRRATPTGRESVELSWAPADEGAEPA